MDTLERFLFVLPNMKIGGVFTAIVNLCNQLVERGYDVDVLIMSDDVIPNGFFLNDIKIFRLNGRSKLWNLNSSMIKKNENFVFKIGLLFLAVLKKILNKKHLWNNFIFSKKTQFIGYNVVVAYKQCSSCYYFALNCVQAEKKLAFIHGDIDFMGDVSTWINYLYDFDSVCYVADSIKKGFVKKYPLLSKNAYTVYNMFNVEEIKQKSLSKIDYYINTSLVNLITVSRVENVTKGILRIPEICKNLYDIFGDVFHWLVIGDGVCKEECIRITNNLGLSNVLTFLGAKDNPYPYIKQSDIFVLPSLTEAFPMTVCESLLLSTPVVVSSYPAAKEQITDGINGVIAEQNIESLTDKIVCLMKDEALRSSLTLNCGNYYYDNEMAFMQFKRAFDK